MSRSFSIFDGAPVLVTGNSGFKGSWLTLWLDYLGAQVHGLSKDTPTTPSLFEELGREDLVGATSWSDACDLDKVIDILNTKRPKFIFHLAAQALVATSFDEPLETWRANTMGTATVLEALRRSTLTDVTVVCITSDKVYLNKEWPWGYRETDELGGFDPYSASKAAAELAIRSYSNSGFFDSRGIRICSTRAGNVIGGGDWAAGRIVPDLVRAWESGRPLTLRNPESTRPWQHVLEPLGGYLLLASKLHKLETEQGRSFNFGPSEHESHTVISLVERLRRSLGAENELEFTLKPSTLKESSLLSLSSQRAEHELGWRPLLNFEETVDWTGAWYSARRKGEPVLEITRDQISKYTEKLLT